MSFELILTRTPRKSLSNLVSISIPCHPPYDLAGDESEVEEVKEDEKEYDTDSASDYPAAYSLMNTILRFLYRVKH